jgi:hypothetical protein
VRKTDHRAVRQWPTLEYDDRRLSEEIKGRADYKNAAGVLGITGVSVKVGTKAPFLSKVTVKGKNLSIP